MKPPRLRIRHIALAFLVGSLLGFLAGPVHAGPLDKLKGKERDRQTPSVERDRSSDAPRQRSGSEERNITRDTTRDRSRTAESRDGSRDGSRKLPDGISHPNPEQQDNLQDLRDSLGALAGGAAAAEDEIRDLAQDLQGMSLQPPDPALTQALAADLADAMADASLTPQEMMQLTQSVYAVMNSAGLSQSELEVLISDVEDILLASGVSRSDVQAVVNDLEAIYHASSAGSGRRWSSEDRSTSRARGSKLGRDGRND